MNLLSTIVVAVFRLVLKPIRSHIFQCGSSGKKLRVHERTEFYIFPSLLIVSTQAANYESPIHNLLPFSLA
jgi:hypothetical protein